MFAMYLAWGYLNLSFDLGTFHLNGYLCFDVGQIWRVVRF